MLWQASELRRRQTQMRHFIDFIHARHDLERADYASLYQFSINKSDAFWREIIEYFQPVFSGKPSPACTDLSFSSYGWFPNMELNYAENLLARGDNHRVAIKSLLENGSKREYTYSQLKDLVVGFQQQIANYIGESDVLACYMPNIAETVVAMLATTGLGGIFTSVSADCSVKGVVQRLGQSRPRVLVACTGYEFGGVYFDCMQNITEIVNQIPSIEKVIIVDRYFKKPLISRVRGAEYWSAEELYERHLPVIYKRRGFSAPLFILYSSETESKPKCVVHTNGGVLLQQIKELALHSDFSRDKNLFFYTSCGWMMWNWMLGALYFGGTLTLYEGSPAFPDMENFAGLIEREHINLFGGPPKMIKKLSRSKVDFSNIDLGSLETVLSAGEALLPEQYDFIYTRMKRDVMLASIACSTDILGCSFLGNPLLPVYRGELQCAGLGMDVACMGAEQKTVVESAGELVYRHSFPSRPLYYLNDPDNKRLKQTHLERYPGYWYQNDFIKISRHGGAFLLGRCDATLNPGGCRIGTVEIYRQTEMLQYVDDAICAGRQTHNDVEVVLFIKMREGEALTEARIVEINQRIKVNTTPRHVPKQIIAVTGIPYSRSGKKMEMAVNQAINGKSVDNRDAIINPECLAEYTHMFAANVA